MKEDSFTRRRGNLVLSTWSLEESKLCFPFLCRAIFENNAKLKEKKTCKTLRTTLQRVSHLVTMRPRISWKGLSTKVKVAAVARPAQQSRAFWPVSTSGLSQNIPVARQISRSTAKFSKYLKCRKFGWRFSCKQWLKKQITVIKSKLYCGENNEIYFQGFLIVCIFNLTNFDLRSSLFSLWGASTATPTLSFLKCNPHLNILFFREVRVFYRKISGLTPKFWWLGTQGKWSALSFDSPLNFYSRWS